MSTGQLMADMTQYVVCVTITCLNFLQCFSSLVNDTHQEGNCMMLVLYVQQSSLGSVVSLFTLIQWVCLCIYILHIGGHCISQSTSNDSLSVLSFSLGRKIESAYVIKLVHREKVLDIDCLPC